MQKHPDLEYLQVTFSEVLFNWTPLMIALHIHIHIYMFSEKVFINMTHSIVDAT